MIEQSELRFAVQGQKSIAQKSLQERREHGTIGSLDVQVCAGQISVENDDKRSKRIRVQRYDRQVATLLVDVAQAGKVRFGSERSGYGEKVSGRRAESGLALTFVDGHSVVPPVLQYSVQIAENQRRVRSGKGTQPKLSANHPTQMTTRLECNPHRATDQQQHKDQHVDRHFDLKLRQNRVETR
jgi:hypothetical protein